MGAAKPEEQNADKAKTIEDTIVAWKNEVLSNSPFSQDTASWNFFSASIGSLAQAILKEI